MKRRKREKVCKMQMEGTDLKFETFNLENLKIFTDFSKVEISNFIYLGRVFVNYFFPLDTLISHTIKLNISFTYKIFQFTFISKILTKLSIQFQSFFRSFPDWKKRLIRKMMLCDIYLTLFSSLLVRIELLILNT